MTDTYKCPSCGRDNDVANRFCGGCGASLRLTCGKCGATSPPDFKFCGSCGAELRAGVQNPAQGEERRVVTVLFADIADFTARAEALDPEDVRAVLSPYYARLKAEVEAFGGTVEKFIGDAVMGIFGAPVAHGDDPERAVRAALSISAAIAEMNAADASLDLHVRVAVNTGEAIVAMGARVREGEGMVVGDVVNTAARLQTAAPADSVLAGEETYRATRTVIEYEAAPPVAAKGKSERVSAWRAVRALSSPGERVDQRVPLIGREAELSALQAVWSHANTHRHAHLVTVFGPPGVGKSRLASEFATAAAATGALAVRGRSLPYGESGAYSGFAHQVKQLAGIYDSDPVAVALEKLGAKIGSMLGEEGDAVTAAVGALLGLAQEDAVPDRQALFYSARRLVEALATEQPTVLVFEDLHWADASLLDLIEHLASRIRERPLLILGLARPDLLETRSGWGAGLPAYSSIPLEPLDEGQSRELAEILLLRAAPAVDTTIDRLAELSEGNPLFLEELVQSVAERTAGSLTQIPTTIRGIVASRLDALPASERALLLDAAVMGRFFWRGAVERLTATPAALSNVLESLEARDIIRRDAVSVLEGQTQYRFKHMLIRDVAYATLPRQRRKEAHAAVAQFLESAMVSGEAAAALAHHWHEAGQLDRARDRYLEAADLASRGWAKAEAVQLYREAFKLVGPDNKELAREIRMKLAIASAMLFHLPDAEHLRASPTSGEESHSH